jgi:hypothetical protein
LHVQEFQTLKLFIDNEEYSLWRRFSYEKSMKNLVGYAEIYLPFTIEKWDSLIEKKDKNFKMIGGTGEDINILFDGTVKNILNVDREIKVEAIDNGEPFKRPFDQTYVNKKIRDFFVQTIKPLGFDVVFDGVPEYILEKRISRSELVATPIPQSAPPYIITGDTPTTVSGIFFPEEQSEIRKYVTGKYVTAVKNYCPRCKAEETIVYSKKDNRYICDKKKGGCGTRYYGLSGYDDRTQLYKLEIVVEPAESEDYYEKQVYSSTGQTIEDELFYVCRANNLYLFITPERKCIIREFTYSYHPTVTIYKDKIQRYSNIYLERLDQTIKPVSVRYNNGVYRLDIPGLTEGKEPIARNAHRLTLREAKVLANNLMIEQLKNIPVEATIETLLDSRLLVGDVVAVPYLHRYPLYIDSIKHYAIVPDPFVTKIWLNLYPSILTNLAFEANLLQTELTEELIGKSASLFKYDERYSEKYYIDRMKKGNSFALSEWLFEMLRKIDIPVRIVEYTDSFKRRQRYVEIRKGKTWVTFPYEKYNIDKNFWPQPYQREKIIVKVGVQ